jgi:uncharacterized repeat protein (TIGR03803 family)
MNGGAFAVLAATLLLMPAAWAGSKYKVLHAFGGGHDGGGLFDGVTLDAKGNLYGTARGGGAYGYGTVFMLKCGSRAWAEATLHSFCEPPNCSDGALPIAGLVFDANGNLYGSSNTATFQMTHDSTAALGWTFQVIYESGLGSSLTLDQARNLYGPMGPGKYGKGAVTELSPGSKGWTETYLYSFCPKFGCLDGDEPTSPLTWDASGNLYGATEGGGKGNLGVVFQLEPTSSGWKEHVLHNFPAFSTDGYDPDGGLTLDQKATYTEPHRKAAAWATARSSSSRVARTAAGKKPSSTTFRTPSTMAAGPTPESSSTTPGICMAPPPAEATPTANAG